MKTLLLACALLISTSSAFAQYFQVNANVQVTPTQVRAVVSNTFYEPVECIAVAFGRLSNGQVIQSQVRDIVPINQFRFAQVFTNPMFPFVQGWAEAHCRFLR